MSDGFTNDKDRMKAAQAYRAAAIADGWSIEPTYKSESVDSASCLKRDGFVMSVLTRKVAALNGYAFYVSVDIWGPDGLTIKPPDTYDWQAIQAGVHTCNICGAQGETQRYSFAGRCCADCLPKMRAEHEKPGWSN